MGQWHPFGYVDSMGGRPVLLVDDDLDSRLLIARVLTLEGYAVITAANGRDALHILGLCRPFVIVLDLEMPIMDGPSFRRIQRDLAPDLASIPIIVCSGSDAVDDVGAEMCALACLSKPLTDFEGLVGHVEDAERLAA